jgi:integrase
MAKIIRRAWRSPGPLGRKVKHVAYGYQLMVNGTRERKVSSDWLTEQDAMTALSERLKAVDAGQLTRPAARIFGALVDEYLAYKRDHGKRSVEDDERILKRALLPVLGVGTPVRTIGGPMIAQYERTRAGQVSPSTVANELSLLRHCLRLARRWGYITTVPEIVLPKRPEGRLRYLDAAEIGKLVKACRESRNRYLGAAVVLALHTGMRKGEILGLEWERVDLSTARLTLVQTKSGKPRGIPMGGAVYEALIALQPDATRRVGRLFPTGNDRRGSQIRKAFEKAMTRAGITGFRFHDLRHTAASHLVMRGATLQEIKEILGHSDIRMTLRYAHLSPAHLRSAVERLEGLTAAPARGADGARDGTSGRRVTLVSRNCRPLRHSGASRRRSPSPVIPSRFSRTRNARDRAGIDRSP